MNNAIIKVPEHAKAGELVTVKVLIRHQMETGHRRDRKGEVIPRNIIHNFRVQYDGAEVLRIDMFPGIAANPYFEFRMKARRSGDVVFLWADDDGNTHSQAATITVT